MAIAASIYMYPPNILLSDANSGYFLPINNQGAFGLIEQINRNTVAFNVGNVVFYNVNDIAAISYNTDTIYKVIDENKVLFIESGAVVSP